MLIKCNYCGKCFENNKKNSKTFSKCKNGNCENIICEQCVEMTIKRSKVEPFYMSYKFWCDTCIWFEIT